MRITIPFLVAHPVFGCRPRSDPSPEAFGKAFRNRLRFRKHLILFQHRVQLPIAAAAVKSDKTLLVYLGAQKSASTWLWSYFREHPQCSSPPLKELHFFDGNPDHRSDRLGRYLDRVETQMESADEPEDSEFLQLKRRFISHYRTVLIGNASEEDSFPELVSWSADRETRVVGEFTPANGMVASVSQLRNLAGLDPPPKFLMILRDPVDRIWSQIRMQASEGLSDRKEIEKNAHLLLERFLADKNDLKPVRYDYQLMLKKARKSIPSERLWIDYFEDFITEDRISYLCRFLGIDYFPPKVDEPRLVSAVVPLSDSDRKRLRDSLLWQYRAAERALGPLPARWRETLAL